MDRNTEREISVESGLAETECLRNEKLILEQAHTKIPSKFNDESVSSDDQSKSSSQCHSPDSGYSSGKIAHPLVIENETNDKIESDAVPGIELNYNDTEVTVSTTELSSECTIEPSIVPTSKEQQQVCEFHKLITMIIFRIVTEPVIFDFLATKSIRCTG